MSDVNPQLPISCTIQRHITDEETVCFVGNYATSAEAEAAAASQLALCRDHMRRYNEEVHLVEQKKREELDAAIAEKGETLKALEREIAEKTEAVGKLGKRLKAAS